MTTDIFITSWKNDIPYLDYCLKSIAKFATGFKNVVLAVAEEEEPLFRKYLREVAVKTYKRVSDPVKYQINAQAIKCEADKFCDADFILHMDSDCIFTEPVTPEDYFQDGRPVMLIEAYARLKDNPWQAPTEKALGYPVKYETMRRHPQVNPIGVYKALRKRVELVHDCQFRDYVLAQKPDFPWGVSEHNFIGAFAFNEKPWTDKYYWIDLGQDARPKDKLVQWWSHSMIDKLQNLPSGGQGTPMDTFKKLGLA